MRKKRFNALHFEITNVCNLRCKHCYNIKYLESCNKDLSFDEVKIIIDKALLAGCTDFGISGGEPFMREDILDVLNYVKGYPVHILSNGLLISDEIIEKLNDHLIEYRISLDGIKSHNLIRGVDSKLVIDRLKALVEAENVVTVNTMITNYNLNELSDMYELMKQLKVDRWRLDFIFDSGNANSNHMVYEDIDTLLKNLKEIIVKYINERPDFELDVNKIFRSSMLEGAKNLIYNLDSYPCEYQGSLTVRPTGDVSFCPSLDIVYGNILVEDLDDIVQKKAWREFETIRVKDIERCVACKYMPFCGGGCRADAYYEQGAFFEVSSLTCELVKFAVEEIQPLY